MVDAPVDRSEARTRQAGTWITLWVAVFLPTFVTLITTGWNGHITPGSLKVIKSLLWLLLAACVVLVAVGIWRGINRRTSR